jgi:hypothetical protein
VKSRSIKKSQENCVGPPEFRGLPQESVVSEKADLNTIAGVLLAPNAKKGLGV